MNQEQSQFIKLCIANEVLIFGEFTLKSGRISPYFFNAGKFSNGYLLGQLATHLGSLIIKELGADLMLFGPAYKGIPIAAATAVNISERSGEEIKYAYNRKEVKDHGEGGNLVGAPIHGNVLILDDVITAGTSVYESLEVIKVAGATLCGIVTVLDRQEKSNSASLSTAQILRNKLNVPVLSLIKLNDLVRYIEANQSLQNHLTKMNNYRKQFGANCT
ncbi:MAG: orotate phosphoribosyltransferase [Gammaproteobacteria bacterium]|nr:orotate phosphoribosyltransferase [Gammaproteobacteria bacterium]MCY4217980.1 orotate phosphoribosyltransferase [Gammaproteobacteria bacterium]MCY4275768.1 orotate phosphoribosyltransferase [Gammaproteobacteria bacterium]